LGVAKISRTRFVPHGIKNVSAARDQKTTNKESIARRLSFGIIESETAVTIIPKSNVGSRIIKAPTEKFRAISVLLNGFFYYPYLSGIKTQVLTRKENSIILKICDSLGRTLPAHDFLLCGGPPRHHFRPHENPFGLLLQIKSRRISWVFYNDNFMEF